MSYIVSFILSYERSAEYVTTRVQNPLSSRCDNIDVRKHFVQKLFRCHVCGRRYQISDSQCMRSLNISHFPRLNRIEKLRRMPNRKISERTMERERFNSHARRKIFYNWYSRDWEREER